MLNTYWKNSEVNNWELSYKKEINNLFLTIETWISLLRYQINDASSEIVKKGYWKKEKELQDIQNVL